MARAGPRSPPLATPARIRLCNEGSPHAGWGGACLWPAQSGYTRFPRTLVHRGGCMVPRPSKSDPWVVPCVVLGMFPTSRSFQMEFQPKIEA